MTTKSIHKITKTLDALTITLTPREIVLLSGIVGNLSHEATASAVNRSFSGNNFRESGDETLMTDTTVSEVRDFIEKLYDLKSETKPIPTTTITE